MFCQEVWSATTPSYGLPSLNTFPSTSKFQVITTNIFDFSKAFVFLHVVFQSKLKKIIVFINPYFTNSSFVYCIHIM